MVNKLYALVADGARDRLLVSNQLTSSVSVFDLSDTPHLLATAQRPADSLLGLPMFAVLLSETRLAVPFQASNGANGAALFDLTTGEELLEIQYSDADCTNPAELSLSSDSRLRLVCEGDHYRSGAVVELDPNTLEIISSVTVDLYPERMSILEP